MQFLQKRTTLTTDSMSLTIWSYTMIYLIAIDVMFLPSKDVNVNVLYCTTDLTFV